MNNVIAIVYVDVSMSIVISADAVAVNVDNSLNIVDNVAFCTGNRFFITKRIAGNVVDNSGFNCRNDRFDRFNVLNDCIGEEFLTISHTFEVKTDNLRPVAFKEQGFGIFVPRVQFANGSAADVYNFKIVPWDVLCCRVHLQFNLKTRAVRNWVGRFY